jgi:hypothetical protein
MTARWLFTLLLAAGCMPPPQAPPPTQPQGPGSPIEPAPTEPPAEPIADPPAATGRAPAQPLAEPPIDATPAMRGKAGTQQAIAARLNEEGKAAMYAQNYGDATAKFRQAVARVPEPTYFFNLCLALYQEGKFGEAMVACEATTKNDAPAALVAKAQKMLARIRDEARRQGIELSVQNP